MVQPGASLEQVNVIGGDALPNKEILKSNTANGEQSGKLLNYSPKADGDNVNNSVKKNITDGSSFPSSPDSGTDARLPLAKEEVTAYDDENYDDDDLEETDADEIEQEVLDEILQKLPPDGGYGWIVVFASFVLNFIIDGIAYSFGVFLDAWMVDFKSSKSKTSWVGSLLTGGYLLMGPLAGSLVNQYGFRKVVIAGALISSLGFVASRFAGSIDVLFFTYGIMGGIGFGLMFLPANVLVGLFFLKKRALATGIAVSGSGVGTLIIAPLIAEIVSQVGWQDALFFVAALALIGCFLGAIMYTTDDVEGKGLLPCCYREEKDRSVGMKAGRRGTAASGAGNSANHDEGINDEYATDEEEDDDFGIEIDGDKIRYNPNKIKVSGLLQRMQIARALQKKQRDQKRRKVRYPSETVHALESVNSNYIPYKGNLDPGVHSIHSLHQILNSCGIDLDQLVQRQADRERLLQPGSSYMRHPPRGRSHHSEMITSHSALPNAKSNASMPDNSDMSEFGSGQIGLTSAASGPAFGVRRGRNHVSYPGLMTSPDSIPEVDETGAAELHNNNNNAGSGYFMPGDETITEVTESDESSSPEHKRAQTTTERNVPKIQSNRADKLKRRQRFTSTDPNAPNSASISSTSSQARVPNLKRTFYRDDVLLAGSVIDTREYRSSKSVADYLASNVHVPEDELAGVSIPGHEDVTPCCSCVPPGVTGALRRFFVLEPELKSAFFLLYCIANCLCMFGFFIPYFFISDLVAKAGVDKKQTAYLISSIGISNTIGRLVFNGVATIHRCDASGRKIFDSVLITSLTTIVVGIVTALMPIYKADFYIMMFLAASFGFFVAPFISLTSIVIADRLGLKALTNGFGILCGFRGILSIVGPPFGGFLSDSTPLNPFYFAGGLIFISGVLLLIYYVGDVISSTCSPKNKANDKADVEMNNISRKAQTKEMLGFTDSEEDEEDIPAAADIDIYDPTKNDDESSHLLEAGDRVNGGVPKINIVPPSNEKLAQV